MSKKKSLIDRIRQEIGSVFFNGTLLLKNEGPVIETEGCARAINDFDDFPPKYVTVTPWLNDKFAVYIKIKKMLSSTSPLYFASICFFAKQGGDQYDQLFRAEWDSYQDGVSHPQPHWHITTTKPIERRFKDLETDGDLGGFAKLMEDEQRKSLNVPKMHFAMSWKSYNFVENSQLNSEDLLIDWLTFLFGHVRTELTYISKHDCLENEKVKS